MVKILELYGLTFQISSFNVELVQVLKHTEKEDPRIWVLSVRDQVVHHESMHKTKHGLLHVSKQVEVTTNSYCVLGGEYHVRSVWLHDAVCVELELDTELIDLILTVVYQAVATLP